MPRTRNVRVPIHPRRRDRVRECSDIYKIAVREQEGYHVSRMRVQPFPKREQVVEQTSPVFQEAGCMVEFQFAVAWRVVRLRVKETDSGV